MCGIAGIYSFNKQIPSNAIGLMTDAIAHRGPDAEGFFKEDTVALGHRRLSIIDLSENANQPQFDSTGNYVIIFNGEIYNYKEVKAKIKNYYFKTNSDTEVVLAAYITMGAKALDELKGMFAFAIYNIKQKYLFIARDRLGVKPIYYYYDKNYFVFASELRAILKSGIVKKEIDLQSLSSYFKMQSFYTPSTIIKGIKQLDAGYFVWVDKNGLQQKKYWDIEKTENKVESVDFATAKKNTKSLLIQSVERRMVSDVPVAAFLSGGIDSSAVVGLMAQLTNSPETFNIAFQEKEYDESGFAEIIAKKFNTKHHKILLKPEQFLEELPNAIKAMDIPSGDGINSYVVSKEIVKKGIKVAMSGVGGDELFAGYPTYKYWLNVNKKKWIWKIPKPIRTIVSNTIPGKSSKYERMKKLLNTENLSLNTFYPLVREVVSDDTINNLFKEDIKPFQFDVDVSNFKNKYLSQMSVAELKGFAYNTLLKDTDQYSMASALEVREPFFDSDLIEYVLQLPDAIKYPSYPKKFLVEALENLLPSEIVHRPKKGFTFPWEYWMRNELQSFCKETIKHFSKRDFVNEQFALAMWEKFYVKNFYRWQEIWLIVILESWLQQNYD